MKRITRIALFSAICIVPASADLLGIAWDTGMLYKVSETNATFTPVGSTGITQFAEIEFAPNGTLYGFTAGTAQLYSINPATAAAIPIGSLGLNFVYEGGLAFSPSGTAYGSNAVDQDHDTLFTINLNTGAATVIGTLTGAHDLNGLAYRSDGKLIGLDRVTNSLLVIDPTTMAFSTLAVVPTTVGDIGGMTVDGGVGYYNTAGPVSGSNDLYSFDLSTGASTLIGAFSPDDRTGISGLAATPSVPEPAPLVLLASVAGILFYFRRRRA